MLSIFFSRKIPLNSHTYESLACRSIQRLFSLSLSLSLSESLLGCGRGDKEKRRAIWQSLYARCALKVLSGVYLCGPRDFICRWNRFPLQNALFFDKRIAFGVYLSDGRTGGNRPAVARTRENSIEFPSSGGPTFLKTVRGPVDRSLSKTVTLRDGQCKLRWRIHMCRAAV